MEEHHKAQEKTEEKKPSFALYIYDHHYKLLLALSLSLLFIALIVLGIHYVRYGNFIDKDVSLKGGITLTIPASTINDVQLKEQLSQDFKDNDIEVRSLKSAGKQIGVIISADIDGSNQKNIDVLLDSIRSHTNLPLKKGDYSLEFFGSSLGSSFFKETNKAIIIAFLSMAAVVFIYFRNPIVSAAVVLAAFSDIIVTFASVSLIGMKLSTAGIAAFLMLIGYSVDTDILLSNKVLKTKEGTVLDRTFVAMKTGLMMTSTAIGVVFIAMIFTKSDVIRQIMIILFIGLICDIIFTWIQNAGLLRLYLEKKKTVK